MERNSDINGNNSDNSIMVIIVIVIILVIMTKIVLETITMMKIAN